MKNVGNIRYFRTTFLEFVWGKVLNLYTIKLFGPMRSGFSETIRFFIGNIWFGRFCFRPINGLVFGDHVKRNSRHASGTPVCLMPEQAVINAFADKRFLFPEHLTTTKTMTVWRAVRPSHVDWKLFEQNGSAGGWSYVLHIRRRRASIYSIFFFFITRDKPISTFRTHRFPTAPIGRVHAGVQSRPIHARRGPYGHKTAEHTCIHRTPPIP